MKNEHLVAIVDDDAPLRGAIDNLLRSFGFVTIQCSSAEAFLRDPLIFNVRLIISDIQMRGMSGLDLQARLVERGINTPMIMITALHEEDIVARALAGGATACLRKPFDDGALMAAISVAL